MIARIWRGEVPSSKADEYLGLMREIALPEYRSTRGNCGAWCFYRREQSVTHVLMVTHWEDIEAIKRFAGEDFEMAKYYSFDPRYLLSMALKVEHFDALPLATVSES